MTRYPSSHISSRLLSNNRSLIIEVCGYFNMGLQREFRRSYQEQPTLPKYVVDLKECAGIDSAGLGMLLLLRDFAQLPKENLLIMNCSQAIQRVLSYSHFDQIFTISD